MYCTTVCTVTWLALHLACDPAAAGSMNVHFRFRIRIWIAAAPLTIGHLFHARPRSEVLILIRSKRCVCIREIAIPGSPHLHKLIFTSSVGGAGFAPQAACRPPRARGRRWSRCSASSASSRKRRCARAPWGRRFGGGSGSLGVGCKV